MITKNAAQCRLCGEVIESTHRHDFKSCSCSEIFIDGGLDYTRFGFRNSENFISLMEHDESN